jgi:hypothetical protein
MNADRVGLHQIDAPRVPAVTPAPAAPKSPAAAVVARAG